MFCPNCGTNVGDSKFCPACGTQISPDAPAPAPATPIEAAPIVPVAPVEQADSSNPTPTYETGSDNANPGAGAGSSQPTPENPFPYKQPNCFDFMGKACDDVTKDPNVVSRTAVLTLTGLVPILNFVNLGYFMRWGRRAAWRAGDKMPAVFEDKTFSTGFFVFLITLICSLVLSIVNLVPVIGQLASLAAMPLVVLMTELYVMFEDFAAAFRFKDLWNAASKDYLGLLAIILIPGLIAGIVIFVISGIFALILGIGGAGAAMTDTSAAVAVFGIFGFVFGVAFALLISALFNIVSLIVYRAMGYWIGQNAPEWVAESNAHGTAPQDII